MAGGCTCTVVGIRIIPSIHPCIHARIHTYIHTYRRTIRQAGRQTLIYAYIRHCRSDPVCKYSRRTVMRAENDSSAEKDSQKRMQIPRFECLSMIDLSLTMSEPSHGAYCRERAVRQHLPSTLIALPRKARPLETISKPSPQTI